MIIWITLAFTFWGLLCLLVGYLIGAKVAPNYVVQNFRVPQILTAKERTQAELDKGWGI